MTTTRDMDVFLRPRVRKILPQAFNWKSAVARFLHDTPCVR
jgi:hypothetical protein